MERIDAGSDINEPSTATPSGERARVEGAVRAFELARSAQSIGPLGGLLRVQRVLGNAAFARYLKSAQALDPSPTSGFAPRFPAPPPGVRVHGGGARLIARFVGSEHAELGDTTNATIDLGDGVELTWGQVVAIAGDEYGTVEELEAATRTPEGKAKLRAALEHDGVPGAAAAKLPEPTAAQRSAHEAEYIRLAMENTSHFPAGGEALGAWSKHHGQALDAAISAGLANDPAAMSKAYLHEAFGQHFLTDAFSGGHIRTPRGEIVAWYTSTFAPRVTATLIANLRTRVVEALVAQANPQAPWTPEGIIRSKITKRVQASIDGIVNDAGGMAALTRWVGLGIAGAISGAMHDAEGEEGVLVSSEAHPEPWRAFGDKKLKDSPVSKEQATKAVAAAKAEVDSAFLAGQEEGANRNAADAAAPAKVHFAFNSAELDADANGAVANAAAQLLYNPSWKVELVGHTDAIGSDGFNEGLGLRRAKTVATALAAAGVGTAQVSARSDGERAPVTSDPKQYRLNRRTEFNWTNDPSTALEPEHKDALARERAYTRVQATVGKSEGVLRFVPRPVEERGGTGNAPLPDWHWGKLNAGMRNLVDTWIRDQVGSKLDAAIASAPALNDVTESGITLHPRVVVQAISTQLLANPTATLGDLTGEAPGPR